MKKGAVLRGKVKSASSLSHDPKTIRVNLGSEAKEIVQDEKIIALQKSLYNFLFNTVGVYKDQENAKYKDYYDQYKAYLESLGWENETASEAKEIPYKTKLKQLAKSAMAVDPPSAYFIFEAIKCDQGIASSSNIDQLIEWGHPFGRILKVRHLLKKHSYQECLEILQSVSENDPCRFELEGHIYACYKEPLVSLTSQVEESMAAFNKAKEKGSVCVELLMASMLLTKVYSERQGKSGKEESKNVSAATTTVNKSKLRTQSAEDEYKKMDEVCNKHLQALLPQLQAKHARGEFQLSHMYTRVLSYLDPNTSVDVQNILKQALTVDGSVLITLGNAVEESPLENNAHLLTAYDYYSKVATVTNCTYSLSVAKTSIENVKKKMIAQGIKIPTAENTTSQKDGLSEEDEAQIAGLLADVQSSSDSDEEVLGTCQIITNIIGANNTNKVANNARNVILKKQRDIFQKYAQELLVINISELKDDQQRQAVIEKCDVVINQLVPIECVEISQIKTKIRQLKTTVKIAHLLEQVKIESKDQHEENAKLAVCKTIVDAIKTDEDEVATAARQTIRQTQHHIFKRHWDELSVMNDEKQIQTKHDLILGLVVPIPADEISAIRSDVQQYPKHKKTQAEVEKILAEGNVFFQKNDWQKAYDKFKKVVDRTVNANFPALVTIYQEASRYFFETTVMLAIQEGKSFLDKGDKDNKDKAKKCFEKAKEKYGKVTQPINLTTEKFAQEIADLLAKTNITTNAKSPAEELASEIKDAHSAIDQIVADHKSDPLQRFDALLKQEEKTHAIISYRRAGIEACAVQLADLYIQFGKQYKIMLSMCHEAENTTKTELETKSKEDLTQQFSALIKAKTADERRFDNMLKDFEEKLTVRVKLMETSDARAKSVGDIFNHAANCYARVSGLPNKEYKLSSKIADKKAQHRNLNLTKVNYEAVRTENLKNFNVLKELQSQFNAFKAGNLPAATHDTNTAASSTVAKTQTADSTNVVAASKASKVSPSTPQLSVEDQMRKMRGAVSNQGFHRPKQQPKKPANAPKSSTESKRGNIVANQNSQPEQQVPAANARSAVATVDPSQKPRQPARPVNEEVSFAAATKTLMNHQDFPPLIPEENQTVLDLAPSSSSSNLTVTQPLQETESEKQKREHDLRMQKAKQDHEFEMLKIQQQKEKQALFAQGQPSQQLQRAQGSSTRGTYSRSGGGYRGRGGRGAQNNPRRSKNSGFVKDETQSFYQPQGRGSHHSTPPQPFFDHRIAPFQQQDFGQPMYAASAHQQFMPAHGFGGFHSSQPQWGMQHPQQHSPMPAPFIPPPMHQQRNNQNILFAPQPSGQMPLQFPFGFNPQAAGVTSYAGHQPSIGAQSQLLSSSSSASAPSMPMDHQSLPSGTPNNQLPIAVATGVQSASNQHLVVANTGPQVQLARVEHKTTESVATIAADVQPKTTPPLFGPQFNSQLASAATVNNASSSVEAAPSKAPDPLPQAAATVTFPQYKAS